MKRKKLVINLLNSTMPSKDNIQLNSLVAEVDKRARSKASLLERMGELLNLYKEHKIKFKEEQFTLFDLANFIHTEVTASGDNELMFLLVNKFKAAYNAKFGRDENAEVDPRKQHDIRELDACFEELCNKNQYEIRVLSVFLEE